MIPLSSCRGVALVFFLIVFCLIYPATRLVTALPLRSETAYYVSKSATDTLFTLSVPWLFADSLAVRTSERLLIPFDDYRIIEPGNRIWLYRPLRIGDTLFVQFVYEPIPINRTYLRRTVREVRDAEDSDTLSKLQRVVIARQDDELNTAWSRLNKSGSLIRSVQVGTDQDLTLESALNLTVVGNVGGNVDVTAALSDQSTPLQPEGTTESLNELDKVYVAVKGPKFGVTLGDHDVAYDGGTFDSYQRKLTGVDGWYQDSVLFANAGAASSKGEFFSYEFLGQEANQGPYSLRDPNGQTGFVVLAGTERVWLNGQQMRRGESNDYVMDYASGQLSFTVRHLINSASRIVVDFQFANEDFERVFLHSRVGATASSQWLTGNVTYISEADSRDKALGTALGEDEKDILRRAGDNADSASAIAADSLGPGLGDYVVADTLFDGIAYSFFQFSPRDSQNHSTGSWSVLFDDFGEGDGDYEASADALGIVYFFWVGPNRGRYRPLRRLPVPESHDVTDVRLQSQIFSGATIGLEGAVSRHDRNTFSELDDQDNDGQAGAVSLGLTRQKARILGIKLQRVSVESRLRARDQKFIEVNRSPEIEFARDWELERNRGTAELTSETVLNFYPLAALGVSGSYGALSRPDVSSAVRRSGGVSYRYGKTWNSSANVTSISSSDSTLARSAEVRRYRGESSTIVSRFSPRFTIERESKREQRRSGLAGVRFTEWLGGNGVRLSDEIDLDASYLMRQEDVLDSADTFGNAATAREIEGALGWRRATLGSAALRLVHREKNFVRLDSADVNSDAGKVELQLSPISGLYDGTVSYQVSRSRSADEILVAVQVTPGTGSYRKVGDQYVPDDQGDYELIARSTGTFQPASDLALNSEFSVRLDELPKDKTPKWLRSLSTETELTIEERTRLPFDLRLYLLDPTRLRGDSTLLGTLRLRQDMTLFRSRRSLTARVRYRNERSLQNQYLNGGQQRSVDEYALRVRAQYAGALRGESNVENSRELFGYANGSLADRKIQRFRLSEDVTYAISRLWEAGLEVRGEEVQDQRSATQASLREFRPHATLTAAGRGRLDLDFAWNHATSNKSIIPFELGRGANRGENLRWTMRGTYAFGQNLSGSLSYTARRDAGEKVIHTGRVEARASL